MKNARSAEDYAKAWDMRQEGMAYKDIASHFGFSTERARQLFVKAERARLASGGDREFNPQDGLFARVAAIFRQRKVQG